MKREKKTHWLRTTILVLLACGILGLILSAVLFRRDPGPTYASAKLVLTFDGAAEGVAPNGTSFDLKDLVRDDVLTEGLKAASLEGTYTPEQIRSCLTVRGVYPDNMADQVMHYESLLNFNASRELTVGDYHPTSFDLNLTDDFDPSISGDRLTALLQGIIDAYRAYFAEVYTYGLDNVDSVFDLEDYDYPQQLQILEGRLSAISGYAKELYEKDPSFRYRGLGFNDLSVQLDNLIESGITRLSADLTINALTKDTERLLTQYQYQILDLGISRNKQEQELEKLDRLIAAYEKNEIIYLSTADSLTKIDGNSSETYDALINLRKSVADGITVITSRITNYELMISDLIRSVNSLNPQEPAAPQSGETPDEELPGEEGEAGETSEEPAAGGSPARPSEEEIEAARRRVEAQREQLEAGIRTLADKGDGVISDMVEMLAEYNARQVNEQSLAASRPRYNPPKFVSLAFAVRTVKTAGPIVAIGFMVCMVLIAVSRRKEER